jgi:hypothetical protein
VDGMAPVNSGDPAGARFFLMANRWLTPPANLGRPFGPCAGFGLYPEGVMDFSRSASATG